MCGYVCDFPRECVSFCVFVCACVCVCLSLCVCIYAHNTQDCQKLLYFFPVVSSGAKCQMENPIFLPPVCLFVCLSVTSHTQSSTLPQPYLCMTCIDVLFPVIASRLSVCLPLSLPFRPFLHFFPSLLHSLPPLLIPSL